MLNLTSFLKHWGQVGFEVSVFGMCKKDDYKNFHPITITIIFIVQTRRDSEQVYLLLSPAEQLQNLFITVL